MKSNPEHSPEYKKFDSAMRQAFSVSKAELQRRLEAEKLANAGKPKRGPKSWFGVVHMLDTGPVRAAAMVAGSVAVRLVNCDSMPFASVGAP